MIKKKFAFNPLTGKLDTILDPNSILIPDGIPSPWDASGGIFPTVVVWTPDWWVISVAGTLPAPVGDVIPGDFIIYDWTNRTVIHLPVTPDSRDIMYIPNTTSSMMWFGIVDFNVTQNAWTQPNTIYQTRWLYLPTIGSETNCVVLSWLIDAVDAVNLWLGTNYGVYYVDDMFNLTQTETDVIIGEYLPDGTFLVNIQVEHGRIGQPTIDASPAIPVGKFEMRGDMNANDTWYNNIDRMSWTQHIVSGNTIVETWLQTWLFMLYDSNPAQPLTNFAKFFVSGWANFTVERAKYYWTDNFFCGMTDELWLSHPYIGKHSPLNTGSPTFTYNIYQWIMDYVSGITINTDNWNILVCWWSGSDGVVLLVDSNLNYITHRVFTSTGGWYWFSDITCISWWSLATVVWQEGDYAVAIEMVIDLSSVNVKRTSDNAGSYYNTIENMYFAWLWWQLYLVWGMYDNKPIFHMFNGNWLNQAWWAYVLSTPLSEQWEVTGIKLLWSAPQLLMTWTIQNSNTWLQDWFTTQVSRWTPNNINRFGSVTKPVYLNDCVYDNTCVFVWKAAKQNAGFPFLSAWFYDWLFMRADIYAPITQDISINIPWVNDFIYYKKDPANVWNIVTITRTTVTPTSAVWTAPTVTPGSYGIVLCSATHEDVLEVIEQPAITAPANDGGPHREFVGAPTSDNDSVDTAGSGWKFSPWYVWLDINTFPATPYICLDSTPTAAVRSKMMMGWEDGYILQSSDGTRHSITLIDDGAGNYNLDIWPTI